MFDYSKNIELFRSEEVTLSKDMREILIAHRDANRERLISRFPDYFSGHSISKNCFLPQGSNAMGTCIQTKYTDEEYDIDDGLVVDAKILVNEEGAELTVTEVRDKLKNALKDKRFNKQPKFCKNCVRVFYADSDDYKHHLDIPIYRIRIDEEGNTVQEIANEHEWLESDPKQVNSWFLNKVQELNEQVEKKGTQLRHLVQLVKRFARSRKEWLELMPNGMKLTMLVCECQPSYNTRLDLAVFYLFKKMRKRLSQDLNIYNLAHPQKLKLTKSSYDDNVIFLREKLSEAIIALETLDKNSTQDDARNVWDSIFKTNGFFLDKDKEVDLLNKASLINSGKAHTSQAGIITTSTGILNKAHAFYAEE